MTELPENGLQHASLHAHLRALRNTLLISAGAVGAAFAVFFLFFNNQLMLLLEAPIKAHGVQLINVGMAEPLVIGMKVDLIAACVAASPVVFGAIWAFVSPALFPREKKPAVFLFFLSVILFLTGAAFAWFIVFRMAIAFFIATSAGISVTPYISIERYVNFLTGFVLPFGLVFELPIVMCILSRFGLVLPAAYGKFRKFVILAIFILAAILTPPDVLSQVLLALPLWGLYEIGIIAAKITVKRKRLTMEKTM